MDVKGVWNEQFDAARSAFEANFDEGLEIGASMSVVHDGEVVVDIWGGDSNEAGDPWLEDTIVNVYSTTKTMAGVCTLMLADRGLIDFDAPVARYWPEFAQNGKEDVLVSHVMSHQAGLPGFAEPIEIESLYDWDAITDNLARQAPWWEPGTAAGYHAITQGYLQGEIVRRVDGRTLGTFFREEVASPLGADFHIGLAAEHDGRVAELSPPRMLPADDPGPSDSIGVRTNRSVPISGLEPRSTEWRRAEIPAAGGIGNARSVARVHSALACGGSIDGVTLMSPETVSVAAEPQVAGKDLVLGAYMIYGMGYGLMNPRHPMTPSEHAFYWGGWGGSMAIIDPDTRTAIAYVMNNMSDAVLGDPRSVGIIDAVYGSLQAST